MSASLGSATLTETISIASRFNGPSTSGNGGYSSGVIATRFLGGPVEVTLRRPVPLDTELRGRHEADETVRVLDGETVIAEARPAPGFELEAPAPVSVEEARRATESYRGPYEEPFRRCFVCGRTREDSFGVFAGPVEDRRVVASPWTPPAWAADESGEVRAEFVWAVLDCPTYFATYVDVPDPLPNSVLGRMTARVDAPVVAGEEHVVVAWPIAVDGRKRLAGSAVMSASGDVLATASALLIEPRPA